MNLLKNSCPAPIRPRSLTSSQIVSLLPTRPDQSPERSVTTEYFHKIDSEAYGNCQLDSYIKQITPKNAVKQLGLLRSSDHLTILSSESRV